MTQPNHFVLPNTFKKAPVKRAWFIPWRIIESLKVPPSPQNCESHPVSGSRRCSSLEIFDDLDIHIEKPSLLRACSANARLDSAISSNDHFLSSKQWPFLSSPGRVVESGQDPRQIDAQHLENPCTCWQTCVISVSVLIFRHEMIHDPTTTLPGRPPLDTSPR